MNCPNCGTATQGPYCPHCGAPVMRYAPAPQPAPASRRTPPWVYVAVLVALAAGTFFLVHELTGKKNDATPPSTTPSVAAPTASGPSNSNQSNPAPSDSGTPTTTSPASTAPPTSSQADIDAAVTKEFDDRAAQDIQRVTISEESYAARVSTKWIGIDDPDDGHPQPYTAQEIKDHFDALTRQYGDQLRILKVGDVGPQTSKIAGKHGWIAVVVNSDTSTKADAIAWCTRQYGDGQTRCGEQHLDAPHPG